jgi:hypothetical protein
MEKVMPAPEHHEEAPGDHSSPVGTWALLCIVGAAMTAGWLFLYFGIFLPRGVVQ